MDPILSAPRRTCRLYQNCMDRAASALHRLYQNHTSTSSVQSSSVSCRFYEGIARLFKRICRTKMCRTSLRRRCAELSGRVSFCWFVCFSQLGSRRTKNARRARCTVYTRTTPATPLKRGAAATPNSPRFPSHTNSHGIEKCGTETTGA